MDGCTRRNGVDTEGSKCVKLESGLRPKTKQFIRYQEIYRFSMLVNKCKIYDEDSRARYSHYKSESEKKSGNQNCGKPYVTLADKGNKSFSRRLQVGKKQVRDAFLLF